MNIIAIINLVGLAGFGIAIATVAFIPVRSRGFGPSLKWSMLAAFGLYAFVSLSNVLQYTGITERLDMFEDYTEVLFVPLIAYILYARATEEQIEAVRAAERAIRTEHDLITSIVDTTPTGILVVDDRGFVSFANDRARSMVSLTPAEGEDGMYWCTPCTGAPDVTEGGRLSLAAVAKRAPLTNLRQSIETAGSKMHMSISATPLLSEEGCVRAVLALEDVTERVRIERELEGYRTDLEQIIDRRTRELLKINRELTDAKAAREEFFANVSHELRTPLNAIIGFTQILLQELPGPLTEEQRTQLSMVEDSSLHLLVLVNEVLDLARIEAGHGAVTLSTFDLGTRVAGLIAPMSALAESRCVRLTCDCEFEVEVRTDADKLGHIVRNLVANGIKFTDPSGFVAVTTGGDDREAFVRVADTGIGIASEHQQRIFEPFQRVDDPDRGPREGTGLGLSLCRELAGLLGGRIELESEPGVGSTFTLRIPLQLPAPRA